MFKFSKKYKPIREYTDMWSASEGEYEGKPMFIRVRSSLKEAVGHPEYPFQIGIAIPLVEPTPQGLPVDDEAEILWSIEDKLVEVLGDSAILALLVTTDGMREIVFYAKEWQPEEFERKVGDVNKLFPSHELQFMMQYDPEWQTFKSFV